MVFINLIFALTAICYAVSCWYAFRDYQNQESSFDFAAIRWLKGGLFLQACSLAAQWAWSGHAPVFSADGILATLAFSLALSLLLGRLKTPVPVLTSFFVPFIFLLSLLGFIAGFHSGPLMEDRWMTLSMASHIFLIFLGFSCFTFGFGVGTAFWVQEGQLKRHLVTSWSYRLPALEALDQLTAFYIGLGFLFWLLGLGVGAVQAFQVWQALPLADPKILGSFLVLVIYAFFFVLRWGFKMRGRKTMVLVMAGYFLALFTFVGVRIFLTTQHAF